MKCDDKEVRALMTASWLRQMGWKDVFVLKAEMIGCPAIVRLRRLRRPEGACHARRYILSAVR
jgi:hypothetical protein